jgi:cyclopropane-fatty-acyl-phospholipid synthase
MDIFLKKAFSGLIKTGSLVIVTASGKRLSFGDGTGDRVVLRFLDRRAQLMLLLDSELRFGELFTDGRIVVDEGTIFDALNIILRESKDAKPSLWLRFLDKIRFAKRKFYQQNIALTSRRNVAHHYDIDERIYALFLDEDWQYSCAYFEDPTASLEAAQLAKKRHVAAKLFVGRGERVLDIGCGWGGLAFYLVETAGAGHVTGIGLSEKQIATARRRAAERKLGDKVTFKVQDYRNGEGSFDRIVSIGMFEHVGLGFYDAFFRSCRDRLADDGVMLLHTIGSLDKPSYTNPWIVKYIFPGGHVPSLSEILPSIERAGLVVTDVEVLRLHYAKTLHEWRRRFLARRAEAVEIYDQRFCRMWEYYLSMAETAFLWENIAVFQIQIARRQTALPLTRNYLNEAEENLKKADSRKNYATQN